VVSGTLSQKYEDEGSMFSLSFIVPDWLQVVRQEWIQDPKIFHITQQLQDNSPVSPGPIIPRLMVKLKLSTSVWRLI
jgi:hypothetical protein